jgi:hypothetical protein
MPPTGAMRDESKRRVRKLKQAEIRIRFGTQGAPRRPGVSLVWDSFFDLDGKPGREARYHLDQLASMDRQTYAEVVGMFFWQVYFQLYRETGRILPGLFDPDALARLGLPPTADRSAVKKRFRTLAKSLHPDTGGDAERFIELVEQVQALVEP